MYIEFCDTPLLAQDSPVSITAVLTFTRIPTSPPTKEKHIKQKNIYDIYLFHHVHVVTFWNGIMKHRNILLFHHTKLVCPFLNWKGCIAKVKLVIIVNTVLSFTATIACSLLCPSISQHSFHGIRLQMTITAKLVHFNLVVKLRGFLDPKKNLGGKHPFTFFLALCNICKL